MFTIKFYTTPDHYTVLCCQHYNVSYFDTDEGRVAEVTLYKDYTSQNGVTYRVAEDISVPHWKTAFIENPTGKTIDKITTY